MSSYLLDASAWIEYLEGTPRGAAVERILMGAGNEFFTTPVTIAEVISVALRKGLDENVAFAAVANVKLIEMTRESAKTISIAHATMRKTIKKFSLSDATVLVAARAIDAKIITGDKDFSNITGIVMI